MTNNEVEMLEPEAMVFASATVQEDRRSQTVNEEISATRFEKATDKNGLQSRFVRLKKSLRRRSVSIF